MQQPVGFDRGSLHFAGDADHPFLKEKPRQDHQQTAKHQDKYDIPRDRIYQKQKHADKGDIGQRSKRGKGKNSRTEPNSRTAEKSSLGDLFGRSERIPKTRSIRSF